MLEKQRELGAETVVVSSSMFLVASRVLKPSLYDSPRSVHWFFETLEEKLLHASLNRYYASHKEYRGANENPQRILFFIFLPVFLFHWTAIFVSSKIHSSLMDRRKEKC